MGKATVLALILAVILAECLAAFFFLGQGEPAAAATAPEEHGHKEKKGHGAKKSEGHGGHGGGHGGHGGHAKESSSHGGHSEGGHGGSESDHKEVDLGEYSIMATDPTSSTMLLVDFHIFGTIPTIDEEEFNHLYEENRHRIRHQVIIIVRSSEMQDLTDASLGLISRQILEKINELLGKPLVEEIIFSKFSFIEQ